MRLAEGVNIIGLHPMMQMANCKLNLLFYQFNIVDPVITSAIDGVHGKNSLHPKGRACDYRIWYFLNQDERRFVVEAKKLLGDGFDVVLEADHIHIEYDPGNPKVI